MLGTTNCLLYITFAYHCIYIVNERLFVIFKMHVIL